MQENFKNTTKLAIFFYKRELLNVIIWMIGIAALSALVVLTFDNLYNESYSGSTTPDMAGMAETMSNPAMIAMVGPIFGVETYTIGPMYAQMMLMFSALIVATMNIFMVVRHTRKDEESGRFELIRSLPVGKLSDLLAAIIICIVVNIDISILTGFTLWLVGGVEFTLGASLLFGACLGCIGIFFGCIAALFSQLSSTSRGAISYSFISLGILYLIRAIGDVCSEALAIISPLGLVMRTKPWLENIWWPIFVILFVSGVILYLAFRLNAKRDLGAGIIAAKPGRGEAKKSLLSSFGLSLRLLKGGIIGWGITIFIFGIAYGSVFGDLESFLEGSEMLQQMFIVAGVTSSLAEQFLTTLATISSIMISVPIILFVLKLRTEEKKGRLENIYSKKVSRLDILFNYVLIAFVSSIVLSFLFGFGLWSAAYASMTEPIGFWTTISSSLVYLPAIWTMIGLVTIIIAFVPRLANIIWGYLGLSMFIGYIGKMLNFPEWADKLIIYLYIPSLPVLPPGEEFSWLPLIVLTVLAALFLGIGFAGFRIRDMIK